MTAGMLKAQACFAGELHSYGEAQGGREDPALCILGVLLSILHKGKKSSSLRSDHLLLSLIQGTKYLKQTLKLSFFRNSYFTMMELIKEKLAWAL